MDRFCVMMFTIESLDSVAEWISAVVDIHSCCVVQTAAALVTVVVCVCVCCRANASRR